MLGLLIDAQEAERSRIARDLHDDVSQRIAGLSIMISRVKRTLRGKPDAADVTTALTSMQESVLSLAGDIRRLSHDLHPVVLQHTGLDTALGEICAQFQKLQTIRALRESVSRARGATRAPHFLSRRRSALLCGALLLQLLDAPSQL